MKRKKRNWPKIIEAIERHKAAGMSVVDACSEEGINPAAYYKSKPKVIVHGAMNADKVTKSYRKSKQSGTCVVIMTTVGNLKSVLAEAFS